jgi:hypothetical protein
MRRWYSEEQIEVLTLFIKEIIMSDFTDAMTALRAKLDLIDPTHIAAIDTAVASLQTAEVATDTTVAAHTAAIADIQAGLAILTAPAVVAPVSEPVAPPVA